MKLFIAEMKYQWRVWALVAVIVGFTIWSWSRSRASSTSLILDGIAATTGMLCLLSAFLIYGTMNRERRHTQFALLPVSRNRMILLRLAPAIFLISILFIEAPILYFGFGKVAKVIRFWTFLNNAFGYGSAILAIAAAREVIRRRKSSAISMFLTILIAIAVLIWAVGFPEAGAEFIYKISGTALFAGGFIAILAIEWLLLDRQRDWV